MDAINCDVAAIAYTNFTEVRAHHFRMDAWSIGGANDDNRGLRWRAASVAILDSGTLGVETRPYIASAIAEVVGAEWSEREYAYFIACNASYPPLELVIDGRVYR